MDKLPKEISYYDEIVNNFRFSLEGIDTVIKGRVVYMNENYFTETSHFIQTPTQLGPYIPGSRSISSIEGAIDSCFNSFIDFYNGAIDQGFTPSDEWLKPSSTY